MNNEVKNAQADEVADGAVARQPEDADAGEQSVQATESSGSADADTPVEEAVDPLEKLQARVASLEDSLLRGKADYQNLQRRTTQQRNEALRYANAELMRALLSVVDDFERSIAAAEASDTPSSVAEGIRLVYDNLMKALRAHGLESIDAIDRPFDPHVHEAMMQQPSPDHPPDTVIEEVAKGYRLRERVLRPARVIVCQGVEDAPAEEAGRRSDEDGQGPGKKKKLRKKRRDT